MEVLVGPCLRLTLTVFFILHMCPIGFATVCNTMNTIGYTVPLGDIVIKHGTKLNITCNINSEDPRYGNESSKLYFSVNGKRIGKDAIDVLNSTSIQLNYVPDVATNDSYVCLFNETGNPTKFVCMNAVAVGVSPQDVTDFTCIGRNYDSFNCSWTPPQNYVKTDYNLSYSFKLRPSRNSQYECKNITDHYGRKQCFWNLSTTPQYRQAQEIYYFLLTARNKFGWKVQNFTIDHFKLVIPNKPEHLTVVKTTPHSIALNWTIPSSMVSFPKGLIHRILYKSEFYEEGEEDWHEIIYAKPTSSKFIYYELSNLSYAHAYYDIRVSMKSAVAVDDSMWSAFESVTVRTESEIPDCPPKTTAGCFEIGSTDGELREVYVYWQKILDRQQNGEHFKYKVEVLGHPDIHHEIEKPKTYVKFRSLPKRDCTINIWSENEKGLSLEKSTVFIPAKRLPVPRNFIKAAHDNTYELSWDHPSSRIDVVNYTIFWCNSERDRPYKCDDFLNWEHVPSTTKRFKKTFSKPRNVYYQFAISANTPEGSSEMVWATCTIIQKGSLGQMNNVYIHKCGTSFVELRWTIECHDAIDVVKGFVIFYCPVKNLPNGTCREPERNVTIIGDKNTVSGRVNGLKPYTMYRFAVAAKINDTHISGRSEYKFNTTSQAAPEPPRNISLFNVTESSISISWLEPEVKNGHLTAYRIYYNDQKVEINRRNAPVTNYVLTDLMSYETYSIFMQACTTDWSTNSSSQSVTTKIGTPIKIKKLYVTTIQNDTIRIEWNKPNPPSGRLDYYQLKFMEKDGDEYEISHMLNVTNVTSHKIENCGNLGSLVIAVRAVNIVINNEHKYGPWSDNLEAECSKYSKWMYIPIIFLFFVISVPLAYYGVTKCYNKYTTMKNIEVKLPPGLDPVVPWKTEKHIEDVDHQSRADEALLLDKMPEIRSGESSGCSSGNESMTCSESPIQTANSDSGTEQPDESIRFRKNTGKDPGYVSHDAIQWGSTKPAPNPASNYCVLGVDPLSNQNQPAASYVPSSDASLVNVSLPYLSNNATPLPPSYTRTEFVKTQNPNYVPYIPNEPVTNDKNNGYVIAGVTKDLMVDDMMISKEENPIYLKGSEFAPSIQFPRQMQDSSFSKTGYVSVGDAPPPKVNKGYVPHRQFDAKSVKGD